MTAATPNRATVLVVEDEPFLRDVVVRELQDAGYEVLEAENGDTALEHLTAGRTVDLLLTDVRLPGSLDGWSIAERFRQHDPGLPVVYASGFATEHRPVPGGVFFHKPFRTTKLVDAIGSLLAQRLGASA